MNYVSAVLGIFVLLLSGIWFGYKNQYEGPSFGIILGADSLNQKSGEDLVPHGNNKSPSDKVSTVEE